jgi:hypothetical protein
MLLALPLTSLYIIKTPKKYRSHTQVLQFLGLFGVANQSRECVLRIVVGGEESSEDRTTAVIVYIRDSLNGTSGSE